MSLLPQFLNSYQQEYQQMRLGLDRVLEVLVDLQSPHKSYPSVLIAGTNGKGSVALMLETILLRAGYRVGTYTSPHFVRFNERIRLSGKEIDDQDLERLLVGFTQKGILDANGLMRSKQGEILTWFEKTTVLAFEAFHQNKIDLAILEVGLGGRFDATNVVDPVCSAITSIGYDHCEVLGQSLREIALEKAGVMRKGRVVVLGDLPLEAKTAIQKHADFIGAETRLNQNSPPKMHCGQRSNRWVVAAVACALQERDFDFSQQDILHDLENILLPGRLQWISKNPPILLDGAHNVEAIQNLIAYLQVQKVNIRCIVLGMMREKNATKVLNLLSEICNRIYFTEIAHPRSLQISDWEGICGTKNILAKFFHDSADALAAAKAMCADDGAIIVTGSMYLVGEYLGERNTPQNVPIIAYPQ